MLQSVLKDLLGSQEVANGLEDTDGTFPLNDVNRTRGENPTTAYPVQQSFFKYDNTTSAPKDDGLSAKRKIPAAFLTCVITSEQDANGRGGNPVLEVYVGRKGTGAPNYGGKKSNGFRRI